MSDNEMISASHAVYALRLPIVLVTKYRRKTLTPALLDALREAFAAMLADWRCTLIEFGGEADHVHLLIGIHPALHSATLINHRKSASSRRMRNRFADHLRQFYGKPYFWHGAYYVGSVGSASLETVKRYVEAQGTKGKSRKRERGSSPAGPPPGLRPRKGNARAFCSMESLGLETIKQYVHTAVEKVHIKDRYLLEIDVHERSIAHRLAIYLDGRCCSSQSRLTDNRRLGSS